MTDSTILVNLDRCIGCWTCSLACKVGNSLDDETYWLTVRTLGSGQGIDRPSGQWPDLHMSWIPVWSKSCTKCAPRTAEGRLPYCVNACPCDALHFGKDTVSKLAELQEGEARIFELPTWENSKSDIVYATGAQLGSPMVKS